MQKNGAGQAAGRADPGAEQEFHLETRHLVFLIALVAVLCVASFMLGRWVERQGGGQLLASENATARGAPDTKLEDAGDVSKDLTFFDSLRGNEPAPLESPPAHGAPVEAVPPPAAAPARPVPVAPAQPGTAASAPSSGRRSVGNAVMIQVFASKDRAAADALRKRLRAKGYTTLLVSERGNYKVRVGPYADREEAERVADLLREQEHLAPWIP